jgi:hypothetical protein
MQKEILGVVYRLPKEDVVKAIHHWLTVVCRQEDIIVEKVEPEFDMQYEDVLVFDGVKVVCKFKENQ